MVVTDESELTEKRWRRGSPEEGPPSDGRAARAQRTRRAVAEGLLNLIQEGEIRPTSKQIAERAGVSERTIFQHFEDLEVLFAESAKLLGRRLIRKLGHISDQGSFEVRLAAYFDEVIYLLEEMSPVRRASRIHEPFSPSLLEALVSWREESRRGIDRVFASELIGFSEEHRRNVLEALALIATWSSWENMRQNSGFSGERARRVMEMSFRSLLCSVEGEGV